MELPFAALHQLCGKMVHRLDHLPDPQANALGVAFGLRVGDSPDRFLVGLAVLSLMSDVAEDAPLLCVIDDTQWLDRASAQTLAFVARRIGTEAIGLLFGTRERDAATELVGLPEIIIEGISDADARDLLTAAIPGRLDERVRDRIIAEARGNPLAIIELPRAVSLGNLAGGFGLPTAVSLSGRIQDSFLRRYARLPDSTRLLLILAAAEPLGDPALLWRAARELGIGLDDATPAEDDGLLQLGDRVAFRHPLVRSAIYRAADIGDRQRVHGALADATDAASDPDRRAWHRAQASSGPDEHVADELERSAGRALDRGGLAAAAAFLERAAELTPDRTSRARRALAAASVKLRAGAPDAALELLMVAERGQLDELQGAQLALLRAQIVLAVRRGSDAPKMLLDAAKRFEPLDASLARETYLEAFIAAIFAGRLGGSCGVSDVAEAARAAPAARQPPRAIDLLLDGLVMRFTEGYAAGVVPLRRALDAFREEGGKSEDDLRWFGVACRIAPDLWDDEAWHQLASRQIQLARDAGALAVLGIAATYRAGVHVHAGEFAAAAVLNEEADEITRAAGIAPLMYTSLVLAAWSGQEARTAELIETSVRDATQRGEGRAIALAAVRGCSAGERIRARTPAALAAARTRVRIRRSRAVRLGVDRAHRGGRAQRHRRRCRDCARRTPGTDPRERHRMGTRDRGSITRVAVRRRRLPTSCTGRRSSGSAVVASSCISDARISSTESGSAASAGEPTPANNSAPLMRCSSRWVPKRSPNTPHAS